MFPQLQDHDLVLCPDFSASELALSIQRTLESPVTEDPAAVSQLGNNSSSESEEETPRPRVTRKKHLRRTRRQANRSKAAESSECSSFSDDEDYTVDKNGFLPHKKSTRRTLNLRESFPAKRSSSTKESVGGRKGRCMNCSSCLTPDCRKCKYCTDMKKYGGPGVKKQSCELRPKCVANDSEAGKKKKKVRKDEARSSTDLDEVESIDVEAVDEIRSGDTIGTGGSPVSPASSVLSPLSSPVKLSNEDQIDSAKHTPLKCTHCEFIAKTESGLKKHSVRYHRSLQSRSDQATSSPKRKIVLDTWQLNCPGEDINNCQKKPKPNSS